MNDQKNTQGFWAALPRPFFALAPMYDVTDAAFRRIIALHGKPDVMFTEFVSADGLCHPRGREKLSHHLLFSPQERPIVVQLFGTTPQRFHDAARLCAERGFDGIDINMGCPEKNVCKNGSGAALIKNPSLAKEIIHATQEGARSLPVSVKTRSGYDKREERERWFAALLDAHPAAITVHARTRKEMSLVPAQWEDVAHVVRMRDAQCDDPSDILIVGNGDVRNLADAAEKARTSGADGVMLGRAVFGNPWLFNASVSDISTEQRLQAMVEHTRLYERLFRGVKNFAIMKKHYKAYVTGFDGAPALRQRLMAATDATAIAAIVAAYHGKKA